MDITQLALTWVGWPNGEKVALSASHRKSTQVHAGPGQTESQVDPGFQLASTCDSVWPRIKRFYWPFPFLFSCPFNLLPLPFSFHILSSCRQWSLIKYKYSIVKTQAGKSHDYRDYIVFKKFRFQNVFHSKTQSRRLKSVFEKPRFRDGLNSGQTDSQVVASGRKLNLRRDLRWVAKRTRKFPHKYTQVEKKTIWRQTYPVFHWLITG